MCIVCAASGEVALVGEVDSVVLACDAGWLASGDAYRLASGDVGWLVSGDVGWLASGDMGRLAIAVASEDAWAPGTIEELLFGIEGGPLRD